MIFFEPFGLGDHLRSPRGTYWHHGIYVGSGRVVHFAGDTAKDARSASARIGTLDQFSDGRPIHVVSYPAPTLPPEEVVANAFKMLGQGGYSLMNRNCEHLAVWAKTGNWVSHQVETAKTWAVLAGLAWLLFTPE